LSIIAVGLVVCAGLTPVAPSQVTTASVIGYVTDTDDRTIPGAIVTIKEVRTGFTRTTTTDEQGRYSIVAIPAGEYNFTVRKEGFEAIERPGQLITQQIAARIDIVLKVGSVSQSVTVEASAPLLETESPANATTLSNRVITELPMIGHNYLQAAILSPGVTPVAGDSMLTVTVGNYFSGGAGFKPVSVSVAGGRPDFTAFIHDGFDVRDPGYGGDLFQPSPEAISSTRIVRGYDSAQFGGEPSIVYVSTKSGTNDYHGSLWEYHQNAGLKAREFNAADVPPLTYNQAGFTFGGPALPQLRNRTFVFGEFQLTRMRSGQPNFYVVPTAEQWAGDLSSIPVQLYNPFDVNPATQQRRPFPNNRIPSSLFSTIAQNYKKYVPLPNVPGAEYGAYNYTRSARAITDDTQYLIRVDQILPRGGMMFAKYFNDHVTSKSEGMIPLEGFGTPLKGQTASLEWDQPLGPNKLNTLRLGFYRSHVLFGGIPTDTDITGELGFRNYDSTTAFWGFPGLSVTGFSLPNTAIYDYLWITTRIGLHENFSFIKGRHSLDFGATFQPSQYPQKNGIYPRGSLTYEGEFTKQSPNSAETPIGFADFLLGTFSTAWVNPDGLQPVLSSNYYSWYVQDKIRVNNKLTVTLGLRWDWWSPPVERYNRWMTFDQNQGKLAYVLKDPFNWQTDFRQLREEYPRGMFLNWKKKNYSPRVGIAYLLTPNTTIRVGGGLYYAQGLKNFQDFASFGSGNPPFSNSLTLTNDPTRLTPGRLDNTLYDRPTIGAISPGASLVVPDIYAPQPYVEQVTFSVERQLGSDMLVSAGYNGAWGRHLVNGGTNINQAALLDPDNPLPLEQRLPYPEFGFIFLQSNNSNSSYNGMHLSFQKRHRHGLELTASYTWSKSIDVYTSSSSGGNNQDARCLHCDRALSDNDRRHYFSLGYVWDLPFGPGRAFANAGIGSHILGNWQLSGITQLRAGTPLTPRTSTSWINVGSWIALPRSNRVCDGRKSSPTMDQYFDAECFPAQPPNTFGNSGRNVIIGPGSQLWDMSLARVFAIWERLQLSLRGEVYSVFNHQNWGSPNTDVFSPTLGKIFGKSSPRTIQLGAKLEF
ncbi:MAG TPA: carboxypeptidase regulatory-like domain-containing protein, partial [Bryobacteraceae bacterium]|nr:carboxypeptidase regulatory-like domain-containing protein [Bryobacteraceae bacterium]